MRRSRKASNLLERNPRMTPFEGNSSIVRRFHCTTLPLIYHGPMTTGGRFLIAVNGVNVMEFVKFIQRVKNLSKSEQNDTSFRSISCRRLSRQSNSHWTCMPSTSCRSNRLESRLKRKRIGRPSAFAFASEVICESQISSQPNQGDCHAFSRTNVLLIPV